MFSKERSFKIGFLAAVIMIAVFFAAIPVMSQEAAKPAPIEKSIKPAVKGILDGKTFVGQMVLKGEKEKFSDEVITFNAGTFHSTAAEAMGFGKGNYKAKKNGDVISFQVKTSNPGNAPQFDHLLNAVLDWKGTVTNEKVSNSAKLVATAIIFQDGKPLKEYNVNAKLKIEDTPAPVK
jgi:hypothetical protein